MSHQRSSLWWTTMVLALLVASACRPPSAATPPRGSISGAILAETGDPFLRVYAREVNSGEVRWIALQEGESTYPSRDLLPGTYVIVGWFHPLGASGAYTSLDTVMAEGEEQMRACEKALVRIELKRGWRMAAPISGAGAGTFSS
jgi:hypothetical protein